MITRPYLKLMLKEVVMTSACAYELGLTKAEGEELKTLQAEMRELLTRHVQGDWGDIDPRDVKVNEDALKTGARVLSSYNVRGTEVWIISDAAWTDDPLRREITTIMRREDY